MPHGTRRRRARAGGSRARGRGGRRPARAPVPLRPRLPRAAPREPGLPLRRRAGAASALRLAAVPRRAGDRVRSPTARYAHEPIWYRELPLRRGARARPRRHRGPRLARRASAWTSPRARRRWFWRPTAPAGSHAEPAPRRARDRELRDAERAARRLRRALHRAADAYLVRRGAARRSSPATRGSPTGGATRSSRCAASASPTGRLDDARDDPARVGRHGLRGHAAEPLSRPRRRAGVQLGRRLALVRRRRARVPRRDAQRGARCPRRATRAARRRRRDPRRLRARHALRHPRRRRRPARAPASRACSSPGWTPRSATGW